MVWSPDVDDMRKPSLAVAVEGGVWRDDADKGGYRHSAGELV